jgi:hypothetical protein
LSIIMGQQTGSLTARLFCMILVVPCTMPTSFHAQEVNCATLSRPGHYPDYENIPRYRVARREYSSTKPPILELRITIPTEVGGTGMVRLACKLASEFSNEKRIQALIFDDRKSARNLLLDGKDQPPQRIYLWHLKAHYELDREKNRHFIEVVFPEVLDGLLSLRRVKYWISSGG